MLVTLFVLHLLSALLTSSYSFMVPHPAPPTPPAPIYCADASLDLSTLPPGLDEGFYVIKSFPPHTPHGYRHGADYGSNVIFDTRARPELTTPTNVTLPVALMVLDPNTYPSLSSARKACRKGNVILLRGSNTTRIRGRAGDRVTPDDGIYIQTRLSNSFYPSLTYAKPPFDLPVLYQDSEMAVINKPAGIVTYSHKKGGHGRMTVRAGLPYVLKPPEPTGVKGEARQILRRPSPVHRLDKNTSGLMVIAKTKGAVVELSRAFAERKVKKTYTAVLNGLPDDGGRIDGEGYATINEPVVGKEAVTRWRSLKYSKSLKAKDNILTMVEYLPQTGRFHQLRIHSANFLGCPIVGDTEHDGGGEEAMNMRENGMFLCSNKITLPHPTLEEIPEEEGDKPYIWSLDEDGKVLLSVELPSLPDKYDKLMEREDKRASKLLENNS